MDLRDALEFIRDRLLSIFDMSEITFDLDGVTTQLETHRSGLLLGVYDEATAAQRLERSGVLAAIRERVGAPVRVRILPEVGILRVLRADLAEDHPLALLTEVRSRLERDRLVVDWILMQHPGRPFAAGGGPLPGQQHPGLGIGGPVLDIIAAAALRLGAVAVIGTPQYFHAAVLYHRRFAFIDPVAEGRFQALRRDLAGLGLREAALAIEERRVHDATFDQTLVWCGTEMALPVRAEAKAWFADPRYLDAAARTFIGTRFTLRA